MAYTTVPGTNVKQRPAAETLDDPEFEVYTDAQGNMHARRKPGIWTKAMPYIVGAGMGYGALASAGAFGAAAAGGGSAASSGGAAAAGGMLPSSQLAMSPLYTGPVLAGSQGASALAAGGSVAANVAQSRNATKSILDWLKNGNNLAGLAGAIPLAAQAFRGGGSSGGSSPNEDALLAEIRTNLGLQRARFQAAQPAFETAQNMALGMAPTRYRSGGGPF